MKMKRFTAPAMRLAIQKVNEEMGPDALILSNRQLADGVEIIAAIDYEEDLLEKDAACVLADAEHAAAAPEAGTSPGASQQVPAEPRRPSTSRLPDPALQNVQQEIRSLRSMLEAPLSQLAWTEMGRREPYRAALIERLHALGLHTVIANRILDRIGPVEEPESGWKQALACLEDLLPVTDDTVLDEGGVIAMVGPTGVGKTTTVAKLAARFALRHGRRHVALVTMDHYRIGAHDQLRTYGRLLGVPVHIAGNREELQAVLNHMHDRKLILIDTAGASQRDERLSTQFADLDIDGAGIRRYLVVSATGQMAVHDEVVRRFSRLGPESCILTKVDEATELGGVLSVLMKHRLPLAWMGDGQRVPDDFHPARARRMVAQAVSLMKRNELALSDEVWMQAVGMNGKGGHEHAHV